jgi:hypothetical protein
VKCTLGKTESDRRTFNERAIPLGDGTRMDVTLDYLNGTDPNTTIPPPPLMSLTNTEGLPKDSLAVRAERSTI